ncbi:protein angel homolog 2 [Topomyia yanbarensis]|uniref:protein angel homolog 2 n=1 Tax=Topomyia yanbarensis TaxID=2498891 RepID=UPI00273C6A7C|nr:protein angel homolog 2 [Topomyia yanbarensis]XP_058834342.1 protein angel homolog 2 [Topomyia yanbarensis]XP_058834344.1 protein angel homolog 2 [Topomyia yanbarensis]XP_058834345.1 protein angel homolog 2 [Topomyia yanbarensis]XP_058834346.1 protein angel homolog 2 [Topomyia yanbarensis]
MKLIRHSICLHLLESILVPLGGGSRGLKQMSRSVKKSKSGVQTADRIIQRYTRQKTMSETCRNWQTVSSSVRCCPNDVKFTLMSYNILAQDLLELHANLYDLHDRVALSWPHRYDRLIAEINLIRPDILCLQELQEDHREQFSCGLNNCNYNIIYKKRTGDKADGCAIYYRKDLFNLIDHQDVEYNQPNVKRLDRENVAIIAKFGLKSNPNQRLIVATTHLLYNPRRQDIRLAQIQVLLAELDRLAYSGHYANGTPKYLPTIVCGDLNLEPYSAPYVLLTTGFLQYENLAANTLEPSDSKPLCGKVLLPSNLGITDDCRHECLLERVNEESKPRTRLHNSSSAYTLSPELHQKSSENFSRGTLRHCFRFCSVYKHNIRKDYQEASTFQGKWITVDYLFYTKFFNIGENRLAESNLKLVATYSLPTVQQAKEIHTIPNMYFGSDHFSLAGQFLLRAEVDLKL